jgi:putative ABC transport system permease protein
MSHFLRLLTYVRRTVLRARLRSTLTILGTALALGLFTFVLMLDQGVKRLGAASGESVLVVFQSSRFCPLTSLLPMRYEAEIQGVPGVASVLPTLLYINSCRSNLDLVTLHGVDPERVESIHDMELLAGDMAAWRSSSDGALVGRRLAQRRNLKVGDRVRLSMVDVEVKGIVAGEGSGVDNIAFVQLAQLQRARRQQGTATEFFVRLAPGADAAQVAATIDARFRTAEQPTETKSMQAFVQGAVGEVAEVVHFARLLGFLAVGVVVLVLGNTVSISAHTRRSELGTMETVGVPRPVLASLLATEGVVLSLLGAILGAGAVVAWTTLHPLTLGIEGWGIDIAPTAATLLMVALVAVAVGLLASSGSILGLMRRPLASAVKEG